MYKLEQSTGLKKTYGFC